MLEYSSGIIRSNMYIKVSSEGRTFKTLLHFAIQAKNSCDILALSIAGVQTTVRATLASIIEGRDIDILDKDEDGEEIIIDTLEPMRGKSYKISVQESGDTTHGFVILRELLNDETIEIKDKKDEEDEEEIPQSFLILAPDGNLQDKIGTFFAEKYSLPNESHYKETYVSLFANKYEDVNIIRNPAIDVWSNIKAVVIRNITESEVLNTVDKALKTGIIKIQKTGTPGYFEPGWDMKDYLAANATIMAESIDQMVPYHDMGQLDPVIATLGRIPLPAQAHAAQAIYNRFKDSHYAFCNGEMGAGKSIISNAVVKMMAKNKPVSVLMTAPATVVPKWVDKEIKPDLPEANYRIINTTEDAIRLRNKVKNGYKPKGIDFTLVSIDRVKLGPLSWAGAAIWRRERKKDDAGRLLALGSYCWHCPDCFSPLLDPDSAEGENSEKIVAGWYVMADSQPGVLRNVSWKQKSPLKKCHVCGAKLWRPATRQAGDKDAKKPRWYISRILKKDLRRYFDLYISDEIHEQKAADSGRGDALGQLVRSAKKVLGLTGTLTNGASTSVKEILWRIAPGELLKRGFDHSTGMIQWASNYGVLEKVVKMPIEDQGVVTRRKSPKLQVRERPGISPRLTVEYLLGSTVFLELPDLGLPLVEKKEEPVFIEMDDEHRAEYTEFHNKLMETCKKRGNWGPFIPATINYADRPDLGGLATFHYFENGYLVQEVIEAPKLGGFTAKERALVEDIQQELSENRGAIIYVSYTDKYGLHKRVRDVLAAHGIESVILPTSINPDKRVAWLQKQQKQGAKVIISNMRLVSTGIDLIPWPTYYFYQLDYNINTVRQAAGRGWRYGQFREVRIKYFITDRSQQVSQLERIMARRGHALLVEAKIDKTELAKYARDAHSTLASDIAECIATSQLAQSWQELAIKDQIGIETVSESEYEDVLRDAMIRLAGETRRLCGIYDTEEDVVVKTWTPGNIQMVIVEKAVKKGRKVLACEGQLALSF